MKLLTRYDRVRIQHFNKEPSLTQQHMSKDCDINNVVAKFTKTGVLDHVSKVPPKYGDFSNSVDYLQACQVVLDAGKAFEALPSSIRTRFANDPSLYLSFLEDPANYDEAVKLGMVLPKDPVPADPISPPVLPTPAMV